MKWLLLAVAVTGCGAPPRCVVSGVEIHGGSFACAEIESAIHAAVAALRAPLPVALPRGSITFRDERAWTQGDDVVNGLSWCFPFEMELGSGELRTAASALPHELAHWLVGAQTGDANCNKGDGAGGHLEWKARGISAAIEGWSP